jgi:phage tail sheath protein FI
MAFQRHNATDANGDLKKFLPWMAQCALAAGRAQSATGTAMLRKPFLLNSAEHVGNMSLYTDTLAQDFNPDDRGQLEEAIAAGLLVWREVSGFGVRLESPDLTSRSRENDPTGWVFERASVLFTCDEVTDTVRNVLENFIGNRTTDTSPAVVKSAIEAVLRNYVASGALLTASVTKVESLGNQYRAEVRITPAEALEAIVLDVLAERSAA